MSDWSPMWPVLMFLPFFLWIMFHGRSNRPITAAERRRATVIASVASVIGVILLGIGMSLVLNPTSAPARTASPQVRVAAPPARAEPQIMAPTSTAKP